MLTTKSRDCNVQPDSEQHVNNITRVCFYHYVVHLRYAVVPAMMSLSD